MLPFSLCNAPVTFQRLMNSVFHQALDDFIMVYLNDIVSVGQYGASMHYAVNTNL